MAARRWWWIVLGVAAALAAAGAGWSVIQGRSALRAAEDAPRAVLPPSSDHVEMTLLCDQRPPWGHDPDELEMLAVLIEVGGRSILVDAGLRSDILLDRLQRLGKDPRRIDAAVITHGHSDHWTGIVGLLALNPDLPIYQPERWDGDWVAEAGALPKRLIISQEPQEVLPGVFTTGAVHLPVGPHSEQGVVVMTPQGPILLWGCAHAGAVPLTLRAQRLAGQSMLMVAGGLYTVSDDGGAPLFGAREMLTTLHGLGVQYVAFYHCMKLNPIAERRIMDLWGTHLFRLEEGATLRFAGGADGPQLIAPRAVTS
jgi:7,8-dihydropterin-6-yl-methyl-4-(beta-D-ribofuranosyl)aminobenzene 5'-phosphate synthase